MSNQEQGTPEAPLYPGQTFPNQPTQGYPNQPAQAYPPQSYPGQTYPGQPYGTQAYTPYPQAQPKPKLTPEARRSALFAGGVSFALMSIGWGIASVAFTVLFAGAILVAIFGAIAQGSYANDAGFNQAVRVFEGFDTGPIFVVLLIVGLLGLGLWVASLFISKSMLARGGHRSPWGITWAATGIAIVASWVISTVLSFLGQALFFLPFANMDGRDVDAAVGGVLALGIGSVVLSAVVGIAIGALSWWWMAHVMRAPAGAADAGAAVAASAPVVPPAAAGPAAPAGPAAAAGPVAPEFGEANAPAAPVAEPVVSEPVVDEVVVDDDGDTLVIDEIVADEIVVDETPAAAAPTASALTASAPKKAAPKKAAPKKTPPPAE